MGSGSSAAKYVSTASDEELEAALSEADIQDVLQGLSQERRDLLVGRLALKASPDSQGAPKDATDTSGVQGAPKDATDTSGVACEDTDVPPPPAPYGTEPEEEDDGPAMTAEDEKGLSRFTVCAKCGFRSVEKQGDYCRTCKAKFCPVAQSDLLFALANNRAFAPCARPGVAKMIISGFFKLTEEDGLAARHFGMLCERFDLLVGIIRVRPQTAHSCGRIHGARQGPVSFSPEQPSLVSTFVMTPYEETQKRQEFCKDWFNFLFTHVLEGSVHKQTLLMYMKNFALLDADAEVNEATFYKMVLQYQGLRVYEKFVAFVMKEYYRLRKLWDKSVVVDGKRTLLISDEISLDHYRIGAHGVDVRVRDRTDVQHYTTDCHYHCRGFGTDPVPWATQLEWMKEKKILFTTMLGIGQRLPEAARIRYYKSAEASIDGQRKFPVRPSPVNDIMNAVDYYAVFNDNPAQEDTHLVMSYSFFDLLEKVKEGETNRNFFLKDQMDRDFPDLFEAAGELNIQKQALHGNAQHGARHISHMTAIEKVLDALREKDFPVLIHCDIGFDLSDSEKKTKLMDQSFCCSEGYCVPGQSKGKNLWTRAKGLALKRTFSLAKMRALVEAKKQAQEDHFAFSQIMKDFCTMYCQNKVIWAHLGGLSLELVNMDVMEHIKFLRQFLLEHPNVWVDVSWDVLYKAYFDDYADMIGESEDSNPDEDEEKKKAKQEHSRDAVYAYLALFNELPTRFLTGTDCVATNANFKFDTYSKALKDTAFIFMLKDGLTDDAFSRIVLGQNYLDVYGDLSLVYVAPRLQCAD